MAGALDGIRVIDFGQYMAGPMAAMLLGDQGADVIRIDPPGGPRWNTTGNATWNRNKRSIVLDLKKAADKETAKKLIAGADVVIENFRPGVMDRLGLGAAAMTAANPRLVYCSLPGFGSDDPRAQVRAWEGVVAAATCTFHAKTELVSAGADRSRPVYTAIPFSSACAAFLCAVSATMALNARGRSGLGQRIEVPLFDATFIAIGARGHKVHNNPEPHPPFMWSRQALCKDGRWVMYVAMNWRHPLFLKETGADEWIKAKLPPEELAERFADLFAQRTSQEWEAYCEKLGTECVTCHTSAEWLEHPQAVATRIIDSFDDPELGRFRGPGINVRLHDTPGSVRSPRPKLDAHREEILKEVAAGRMPPSTSGAEPALRAALQGVKVLDLCIILAGPAAGRTLAEFGADVIKIDDPNRRPLRLHNDINRGKRTLLLDLKKQEGVDILWKLIDQADVILQNYRKDAVDKLGFGYEAVKARRPDIIYASLNTFGQAGPFAARPGHEQLGQAISGMQMRYGGGRPVLAPFSANDYGTGLMGAYAVALALLERKRSGRGQMVETALAFTATMLQSALLQGHAGKQWNEPSGQEALGSGPLQRAYKAADGWLFLGARSGDVAGCRELADLAGLAEKGGAELERVLQERIKTRSVSAWVEVLTAGGIGAHAIVDDVEKLMQEPLVVQRGLSLTREHAMQGPVTTNGTSVRLSRTPATPGAPAGKPGADAPSVLAEIGMGGELERLVKQGVVVTDGVHAG